jgi:hypothetical protein
MSLGPCERANSAICVAGIFLSPDEPLRTSAEASRLPESNLIHCKKFVSSPLHLLFLTTPTPGGLGKQFAPLIQHRLLLPLSFRFPSPSPLWSGATLARLFPSWSSDEPHFRIPRDMSSTTQGQQGNLDRYVVIHVATTCDEHGVYVTKDSAEVIELGWILLDAKSCEEVSPAPLYFAPFEMVH